MLTIEEYGREMRRRITETSIYWELFASLMVGVVPWGVRSFRRGDVGMPELMDLGLSLVVFAVMETIRRAKERFRIGYDLYSEQVKETERLGREVEALKVGLAGRQKNREWAKFLSDRSSLALHNIWANAEGFPVTMDLFITWRHANHQWAEETKLGMERLGFPDLDIKHFDELGELDRPDKPYHGDASINKELVMINMMRKRLKDLINKYNPD